MNDLSTEQSVQEDEYDFPYHYLDKLDFYKYIWNIEYLDYLRVVKYLLKPYKGQRVLDAGCGDGRFCYELAKEDLKVVGVDFSERALRFAKAFNPNVEFIHQDLEKFNFSEKFSKVVLIETLEHIHPSKIYSVLENLSSVLKKEGDLIITVPSVNRKLNKKHYQHFTEESLKEALEKNFKSVRIFGYFGGGYKRKLFLIFKVLCIFVYPFRNRLKFIKSVFSGLENFYKKNLSVGKPEKCLGLIAVCKN